MQSAKWLFVSLALVAVAQAAPATPAEKAPAATQPAKWEKDIKAFEAQDQKSPPPTGEIVFVGSSSIRMWDTKKYFPDIVTIQRGFGGSCLADSVTFCDRIVTKYRPRTVVLYAGDNDISAGLSPEGVLKDYQAFAARVHAALPATRIIYIAIKPSIRRWALVEKMRRANALIAELTKTDGRLAFLDIDKPMIGADGKPRKELFKPDGLHLSHEGYVLWSGLLRPMLLEPTTAPRKGPQGPAGKAGK
jgi:lysophospholipase L1-like esterase